MYDYFSKVEARGISIGRNEGYQDAFNLMVQQGLITPEAAQRGLIQLKSAEK